MRIIKDLPQHLEDGVANPEWLAMRAGKFTGSDFYQYMVLANKDTLSETAENNLYKKVLELMGYDFSPTVVTEEMARGTELEPIARQLYIEETFNDVQQVAFVDLAPMRVGCSPDGVMFGKCVDVNGVGFQTIDKIIEIKCPNIKNYLKMVRGKIPPIYECQMQFNMFVCGCDVCDFIVYHPDMRLNVQEIHRDEDYVHNIKTVLEKLNTRYDEILCEIEQYKK